jgi:hypothetical protein
VTDQSPRLVAGNVALMHQTESAGYYQTEAFQAVELPYAGTNATMVILLPLDYSTLPQLAASLTPGRLDEILTNLFIQPVEVYLPKFNLQWSSNLIPVLETLGMTNAFFPGLADLSGMDGADDLSIGVVVHKADVDVDETGTVAAAATGVGVTSTVANLTPVFRADHPFLFLIRDTHTGSILFMGRIADPTADGVAATGPVNSPTNHADFLAAAYAGLFYDTNAISPQSSGALSLSVATNGSCQGTLELAGKSYPFAAQFIVDPQSNGVTPAVVVWQPPLPDLVATLQPPDANGALTGTVHAGTWTAQILCGQTSLGYNSAHPAPPAGIYNLALVRTEDGTPERGLGGSARLTVAANGLVSLAGQLADGTPISQTSPIAINGYFPLYIPLYAGQGSLLGWIHFTNPPARGLAGTAAWIKTGAYGPQYPRDFTNTVTIQGSALGR